MLKKLHYYQNSCKRISKNLEKNNKQLMNWNIKRKSREIFKLKIKDKILKN